MKALHALAFATAALLVLGSGVVAAATVEITVTNIHEAKGTIRMSLCPEALFLKDNCPYSGSAPAVAGQTTVVITNVQPGIYAAQGYQDVNDNHEIDRTLLGVPEEGVAFSRNPSYLFSPPDFKDASFTVGPREALISVRLRYF
ncbi:MULTISPECIES: DUF2141 domain-containing protein [Inquilinus]|jgi:uncharacterized protein (DUF2141 family)|uniref:Uncharacterized protein (DUF2141 family) n=1 Tax=Inquilinus ginsengisoli TaxID=363840 RepID=A0ABU1K0J1_9PROT|nr:DUF2141 domain-containing protein [Inquilinus ginsengisoli]MDR6293284.1 uncharacterized protein (DUF2141 family) [Inquilinus ginsengisoli]